MIDIEINNLDLDSSAMNLDDKLNIYCREKHPDKGINVRGEKNAIMMIKTLWYNGVLKLKYYHKPTDIEEHMQDILDDLHINYKKEWWINKKYRVDFFIPEYNLIIECDGFKYHSKYADLSNDLKRQNYLVTEGYKILRYMGRDINQISFTQDLEKIKELRG